MIILAIALLVSVCLNVFLVLRLTTTTAPRHQLEESVEPEDEQMADEWMEYEMDRVARGTRSNPNR